MINNYIKILNHISDNESKKTIKKFADSLFLVEKNNMEYCTDFFNPKEIEYAIACLKYFPTISYSIIPNVDKCERNCIVINKNKYKDNIYLDYLLAKKVKNNISHRDILGSILALGITREKIGDILISDDEIIIILKSVLSNYIIQNLDTISKYKVIFEKIDFIEFDKFTVKKEKHSVIISSLRIDNIIAEITNFSRKKTNDIIKKGIVKVNHEEVNKAYMELKENDIISIKGFGRYKVLEILGRTKKDKIRIIYEKFL